ncbi:uncharacterized protein LOC144325854 [Podarcis muralis]
MEDTRSRALRYWRRAENPGGAISFRATTSPSRTQVSITQARSTPSEIEKSRTVTVLLPIDLALHNTSDRERWKELVRVGRQGSIRLHIRISVLPIRQWFTVFSRLPSSHPNTPQELGLPASESLFPLISSRIRCLRRLFRRCHRVAPQPDTEQPVAPVLLRFSIPAPGLLEDEQLYILGVINSCQAAELRGLRSLMCSKEETAQKILDILGPLEHFRDRPLTLALALEALLQLSTIRPRFTSDMVSSILHRMLEAVLCGAKEEEEEREELKRHYRLLLGSLLMEAPNPGTLLQLLSDLRGYALGESGEAQQLAASSISLLLAIARKYPKLRMTVIRPELACFRRKPKEDDIIIEDI